MEELKLDDMKEKVKKTQSIVNNLETNNIHIHLKVVFTIIEKQLEDEILIRNILERYGEINFNKAIKNYCDHFNYEFNPLEYFFPMFHSTAGIDGWMRYYEEPL